MLVPITATSLHNECAHCKCVIVPCSHSLSLLRCLRVLTSSCALSVVIQGLPPCFHNYFLKKDNSHRPNVHWLCACVCSFVYCCSIMCLTYCFALLLKDGNSHRPNVHWLCACVCLVLSYIVISSYVFHTYCFVLPVGRRQLSSPKCRYTGFVLTCPSYFVVFYSYTPLCLS